jgi:hypothetical protein
MVSVAVVFMCDVFMALSVVVSIVHVVLLDIIPIAQDLCTYVAPSVSFNMVALCLLAVFCGVCMAVHRIVWL